MEAPIAETSALMLMKELGLLEHKGKKIFELSKGTQQKIQITGSIIHNPVLFVWDEPFSGLDPLSVKFVIETLEKEKKKGKTIILSTHNMNIAEKICDRVIVINNGRRVLYGKVTDIKERYSENSVIVEFSEEKKIDEKQLKLFGVKKITKKRENTFELLLDIVKKQEEILAELVKKGFEIKEFGKTSQSLEEIFLAIVKSEQWLKE